MKITESKKVHKRTQNGSQHPPAPARRLENQAGRHPRLGSCKDEPPLIEGCGPSYFPSCAVAFALAKLPAMSTAASKFSDRPSHTFRYVTSKKEKAKGLVERGGGKRGGRNEAQGYTSTTLGGETHGRRGL